MADPFQAAPLHQECIEQRLVFNDQTRANRPNPLGLLPRLCLGSHHHAMFAYGKHTRHSFAPNLLNYGESRYTSLRRALRPRSLVRSDDSFFGGYPMAIVLEFFPKPPICSICNKPVEPGTAVTTGRETCSRSAVCSGCGWRKRGNRPKPSSALSERLQKIPFFEF